MPAVTRSTIQVHSFGEQLSTRITPSLPAPHHPASETLHLHDFITAAAHQQWVSCCEKYNYKSKSYICSTNLPKDSALEAIPKQICLCACGACTHMTSRGCHNRELLFSKLTFHRTSQKSSFWSTEQCLWYQYQQTPFRLSLWSQKHLGMIRFYIISGEAKPSMPVFLWHAEGNFRPWFSFISLTLSGSRATLNIPNPQRVRSLRAVITLLKFDRR